MFFPLSKLIWFLLAPSHLLLWLVLAAALAQLLRRLAAARALSILAALLFVCAGIAPLWVGPVRALEDLYPRPSWPAHVDGVLVLGGGLNLPLLRARGVPATEESLPRLTAGFEAARRYPQARLVFSGGPIGSDPAITEAQAARYLFAQMGADPARLVLEDRAHDTYENILFTKQLMNPRSGEVWLLATSAIHMPRAMAVAERLGWRMLPWPTDYRTQPQGSGGWFAVATNLGLLDYAAHEWLGLLAYRWRDQPARR